MSQISTKMYIKISFCYTAHVSTSIASY